ncbi:hypothetical protein QBC39DRAFT_413446 [Podospora conica]|nr:hypothetical protein QBC39DRAFT_413446 [Schizothecium conicum]
MKSIALAIAAILAPFTLASPTSDSQPGLEIRAGVDLDALPSSPMTWSGSITADPSGPVLTFSGTAKSIYEQIVAANPDYAALHPVDAPLAARDPEASSLDKRRREFDCNSGTPTDAGSCDEGLGYLRALGNGEAWCGANANSCARVSCSWRCGLHLCNFGGNHFQAKCRDIARDIVDIKSVCQRGFDVRGRLIFDRHYTQVTWNSC